MIVSMSNHCGCSHSFPRAQDTDYPPTDVSLCSKHLLKLLAASDIRGVAGFLALINAIDRGQARIVIEQGERR